MAEDQPKQPKNTSQAGQTIKETAKTGVKAVVGKVIDLAGDALAAAASETGVGLLIKPISKAVKWLANKIVDFVSEHKEIFVAAGAVIASAGLSIGAIPLTAIGLSSIGIGAVAGGATTLAIGTGVAISIVIRAALDFLANLGKTAIITVLSIILLTAFIIHVINSGAYLVPPGGFGVTGIPGFTPGGSIQSPYISVVKTPEPSGPFENSDLPLTITYTVTINATRGTLTNVTLSDDCKVIQEDANPNCPTPNPSIPASPGTISPAGGPFTFTFTMDFNDTFQDSLIINTITVNATSPDGQSTSSSGAASIRIGDPPDECPNGWPLSGAYVSQGAYAPGCSHRSMEATDFGTVVGNTVVATHSGVARVVRNDGCLGNYVEIISVCEGRDFFSQYAHMSAVTVSSGTTITQGQILGLSGNTGSCTTGPHLHYRFIYTNLSNPSYPSNPPYMWTPYIPANVPRGCCTAPACGNINL